MIESSQGIYLGFDISTSRIGISVFDEKFGLIEIKCLELEIDKDVILEHRLLAKANIFKEYLLTYKNYNILDIVIEEPLFGSNNAFTANMLMRFNGMASYILHNTFQILPQFISVHEWRSTVCNEFIKINNKGIKTFSMPKEIDKKLYILQKISGFYPNIKWEKKKNGKDKDGNFDMADAVGLMLAFFVKNNKIKLKN